MQNKTCTLTQKKCVPCEGGTHPLTPSQIQPLLEQITDWKLSGTEIYRDFKWKNFAQVMNFVNEVARLAEEEGHHPDILIHDWKFCRITLTTHAIHGLSENDFILAAKIEAQAETREEH